MPHPTQPYPTPPSVFIPFLDYLNVVFFQATRLTLNALLSRAALTRNDKISASPTFTCVGMYSLNTAVTEHHNKSEIRLNVDLCDLFCNNVDSRAEISEKMTVHRYARRENCLVSVFYYLLILE